MNSKKLVVGLGNPGSRYRNTPHNLGFEVVDLLAGENRMSWSSGECFAQIAEGPFLTGTLVLVKPQTYMNLSGQSVSAALGRYSLTVKDLIVVCDDLALPLGKIRIRGQGGAGGHNGLKSIIEAIDSMEFTRVRLGILPDVEILDASEYVLSPFVRNAEEPVQTMIEKAKEAVKLVCSQGLLPAMNCFN